MQQVTSAQYNDFVMTLFFRNKGDLSKDFAHAAMGMATETLHEWPVALEKLDAVNILEEVGDLLFFTIAALNVMAEFYGTDSEDGRPFLAHAHQFFERMADAEDTLPPFQGSDFAVLIGGRLMKTLDVAKNWVGYGKKPRDAEEMFEWIAGSSLSVLRATAKIFKIGLQEMAVRAALANIDKLQERYPGGFSLEASINRNTDKEREVLDAHQRASL